uniref:Transcription factor domain-containing protein n=1 Tax=Moniliophthora roreri TaxID=221103 RepID=A0A0W0EU63_MONRR
MSSDEEGLNVKKRKVLRACDICRRKKSDGIQTAGRCSNCIASDFECTYVETAKKRGPPKAYVEGLENRVEKMEQLIREFLPDEDLARELGNFTFDRETWTIGKSDPLQSSSKGHDPDEDPGGEQDSTGESSIFPGNSSSTSLTRTALELKLETLGWSTDSLQDEPEGEDHQPWEDTFADTSHHKYQFPEDDLMTDLIDLYFTKVNILLPVLHRPTFERNIAKKLHLESEAFADVLLLVCANASRMSDDPRVLLPGVDSWLSCGWKWFVQIDLVDRKFLDVPTLYDVQSNCLYCIFLQGSSAPHACWTMVGIGLRMAQQMGAHRRRETHTVEDELVKRAFWCLLTIDRHVSAVLGRPCDFQDEDHDLDMPCECDDEYWEHPNPALAFRQPPGRPSFVSAFNSYLKLLEILAAVLRTLYCVDKPNVLLGFMGSRWEQRVVAELDGALNRWVGDIPEHVRWDPQREDDIFFNQSAILYTNFYNLQILIHRQFTKKSSPLSFPSIAICANAARSCSHIVDTMRLRKGFGLPWIQTAAFTAGVILLLNIWGGKRSGLSIDPVKEMSDVHKCMQVLHECQKRWHMAGRSWDIMYELATVGELPLPKSSPNTQNKRERDSDSTISSASSTGSPSDVHTSGTRTIASSKRVAHHRPSESQDMQVSQPEQQLFPLPMYSDDLGRLPLHGQLNYAPRATPESLEAQPAAGYWFSGRDGATSAAIPTQNPATGSMHDLDLPAGFPELADAEFFEQLTSVWQNGRTSEGQDVVVSDGGYASYHHSQLKSGPGAVKQEPYINPSAGIWSSADDLADPRLSRNSETQGVVYTR